MRGVRLGLVAMTMMGALVLLGGCAAQNYSAQSYRTGLSAQRVEIGKIVAIRSVALQPDNAGGTVGTLAGGLVGSQLGGESDSFVLHGLGLLGGAVIGGMLGQSAGSQMTASIGELVTVRLDNGRMIAVTQEGGLGLHVGQRVQVLYSRDGTTRVLPF